MSDLVGESNVGKSRESVSDTDDAFSCVICYERYTNPRLLPCGHSFCSSPKHCLSNLLKMFPKNCAVCRQSIPGRVKDVDERRFPKNFALSNAMEIVRRSHFGKERPVREKRLEDADWCLTHGKREKFYCKEFKCCLPICINCWKSDHLSDRNHNVVPYSVIIEEREICRANFCARKSQSYRSLKMEISSRFYTEKVPILKAVFDNILRKIFMLTTQGNLVGLCIDCDSNNNSNNKTPKTTERILELENLHDIAVDETGSLHALSHQNNWTIQKVNQTSLTLEPISEELKHQNGMCWGTLACQGERIVLVSWNCKRKRWDLLVFDEENLSFVMSAGKGVPSLSRATTLLIEKHFVVFKSNSNCLTIADLTSQKWKIVRLSDIADIQTLVWFPFGKTFDDQQSGFLFVTGYCGKVLNSFVFNLNLTTGDLTMAIDIDFVNSYGRKNIEFVCSLDVNSILCKTIVHNQKSCENELTEFVVVQID